MLIVLLLIYYSYVCVYFIPIFSGLIRVFYLVRVRVTAASIVALTSLIFILVCFILLALLGLETVVVVKVGQLPHLRLVPRLLEGVFDGLW